MRVITFVWVYLFSCLDVILCRYTSCGMQEGSQFCRGFGGIGGILRYQLDMRTFDELSDDDGVYNDDF